jgi:hypothetical protein
MKLTSVVSIVMLAALCGCTTASRTITSTTGEKSTSKASTFLTTFQGYDDSISADGATHTSIANYSSDVQAILAIGQILDNVMSKAIILAGNNNVQPTSTNLFSAIMLRRVK